MMAKIRGKGEGTVVHRPDGRWMASFSCENGKRRSVYAKTKREVTERMRLEQSRMLQGMSSTGQNTTVEQYLNTWLADSVMSSRRPKTFESYDLNVRRAIPHIGKYKLVDLQPAHLQRCYAQLLEKGLSGKPLTKRSVNHTHTVLHTALAQAVKQGRIFRNPADAVDPPRPEFGVKETLTKEEVERLFDSTAQDRLGALWVLLVTTGVRIGEALGLSWCDVEPSNERISVKRALQRQKGKGLVFVEPKTKSSRRAVYLSKTALDAIRKHEIAQKEEFLGLGIPWHKDCLIFCNQLGNPLDPGNVRETLGRRLKGAGLPKVRTHDLRHTAATLLLQEGVHPKIVQEMLGHSTIMLTLDTYSHVLPAMHRDAAVHMDALFGNQSLAGTG